MGFRFCKGYRWFGSRRAAARDESGTGRTREFPFRTATAIAALLLLAAQPAWAQTGSITGRVTSADNGQPVADAQVQAVAADGQVAASALSTGDGAYRLTGLEDGAYTIVVTIAGFQTERIADVQVVAGQTTMMGAQLAAAAFVLNPVVVSASKQEEMALDAPASVSVVDSREIEQRPTVAAVDHLRDVPGVDVITYGMQGSNIVTRGFNNVFSGALHMLTDYRLAHVPSLRVNLLHFIPATEEDIDRMEVVLGPGSALYGPNTAHGVLHIITKSPLDEQSTAVSLAGGERSTGAGRVSDHAFDVFDATFRTAHLLGDNFGFKLSGEYMRGDDWVYIDPAEQEARRRADADPAAFRMLLQRQGLTDEEIDRRFARIAQRDFGLEKWSLEARADWRVTPDLTTVFSVGRTNVVNGIELTGLGAAQAQDWAYGYYQARASYNRFFGQIYLNTSDAGDTYTLKDGEPIIDRSKLFAAQLQHGFSLGTRQDFTYGIDFIRTLPESEGTIYGINEDDTDMTEIGGYVQSETALSPQFDLVLAARVDKHSEIEDPFFSPRAAVVFKPTDTQSFRVTYNRAYANPTAINLFLDKSGGLARGLGELGFLTRGQGTTSEGFQFQRPDGSLTGMRSPFTPQTLGGPSQPLPGDAATLAQFWDAAVTVMAQQAAAADLPVTAELVDYMLGMSPTGADVGIAVLDPLTGGVTPLSEAVIPDVPPITESLVSTFEVGYTGILADRVRLTADAWFSQHEDFVSPLVPVTPLLLYNGADVSSYLVPQLIPALMGSGLSQAEAEAAAAQIAAGVASVPLGVVSSEAVNADGADIMASYRNFGDVNLWGVDLSGTALLTDEWSVGLSGSWTSKDHLRVDLEGQEQVVALNAPQLKSTVSLGYRDDAAGFNGELRMRYTDGFPANSADFVGTRCILEPGEDPLGVEDCVDAYTLFDLTLGYQLPGIQGASLQLSVTNLFDEPYRSFVGVPEIGRLALLRLRYAL